MHRLPMTLFTIGAMTFISQAAVIKGTVTDTLTNAPIDSALVQIKGTSRQAYTDSAGRFTLNTSSGILAPRQTDRGAAVAAKAFSPGEVTVFAANGMRITRRFSDGHAFPLAGLPCGVYFVNIRSTGGIWRGKILVPESRGTIRLLGQDNEPAENRHALAKTAATITLAFSHPFYTVKEADAAEGDTSVSAKLRMWLPDSTNSGVPTGTALTNSGSIRVDVDGTVIENKNVTGNIDIYAKNVMVRNCRIQAHGDYWGVQARSTGASVINCTIDGTKNGGSGQGVKQVSGDPMVVRGCNISNFSDGIMIDAGTIENNYIHDLSCDSTAHYDGIQNGGGGPCCIRHNTILNQNDQTSCIALFQDFGVPHDILAECNYMAGGGYTVYGGAGSRGAATNIKFTGNQFSKRYHAACGYYGYLAYGASWGTGGNVWSFNVWDSTGASVGP